METDSGVERVDPFSTTPLSVFVVLYKLPLAQNQWFLYTGYDTSSESTRCKAIPGVIRIPDLRKRFIQITAA